MTRSTAKPGVAILVGLLVVLAAFPAIGDAWTVTPGYKRCDTFTVRGGPIHVEAKHISCRTALKVQKEYWLAPESEKELVGPNEYNGYVRLKRFLGWHCTSGAGAGDCVKGRKEAAYTTFG
jgi:hypothetical protein